MLTALLIIAFVYPVVYAIRRFILQEPKYTGDVDGDQNTQPIVGVALGVSLALGIAAFVILWMLKVPQNATSPCVGFTLLMSYRFMRS